MEHVSKILSIFYVYHGVSLYAFYSLVYSNFYSKFLAGVETDLLAMGLYNFLFQRQEYFTNSIFELRFVHTRIFRISFNLAGR